MVLLMFIVFIVCYVFITLEHTIKINKAATALIGGMVMWTLYIFAAAEIVPKIDSDWFECFIDENSALKGISIARQSVKFVTDFQLLEQVGDVAQVVFFLMGAMTIVELIDIHDGFSIITDKITTRSKRKLLVLLVIISFFLSSIIDNLTTAIVMIALLNKLVADKSERWWFAGIIILAANSGGAWSPIGDVTTILLWVKGTVTPLKLIEYVFLPSVVSVLIPLLIVLPILKGELPERDVKHGNKKTPHQHIDHKKRLTILILGIAGLISVPFYKNITSLPPFTGIMLVLGILWVITDVMYRNVPEDIPFHLRVSYVVKRIDMSTLLFFFGILMAVASLQSSGGLISISKYLEEKVENIYVINLIIGVFSSIVDNVPLVAAAIGLYPIADAQSIALSADPAFTANFLPDGIFWHFLTYCAGVGGSLLIIGSAAGVVIMGTEKINFFWYLRKISLLAFIGYLAGAAVFILEIYLIHGKL